MPRAQACFRSSFECEVENHNLTDKPQNLNRKSSHHLNVSMNAPQVKQVSSLDQLALAIRMEIEEECGRSDPSQINRPHEAQETAKVQSVSLQALCNWNECIDQESTSGEGDLRFCTCHANGLYMTKDPSW